MAWDDAESTFNLLAIDFMALSTVVRPGDDDFT